MHVRTMTPADMDLALSWAADEGWNPGDGDAHHFLAADPGGFLVAEDGGEMVGTIGMPRFGPRYAFAGLYIVRPDHRGGATGAVLARAALRLAGDRVVGTDGVLAREADYAVLGFVRAHTHQRHSGIPLPSEHAHVRPAGADDAGALAALDDACFPGQRRDFIRAWVGAPRITRMWVDAAGTPEGFGTVRQAAEGRRIGPLIAPHAEAAAAIVRSLAAAVPGEILHLDVNTGNPEGVVMARDLGLVPGFECVRMYRGGVPDLPLDRMWGGCTLELG